MSIDMAQLVLAVDTTQVKQGQEELAKLAGQGAKTGAAIAGTQGRFDGLAAAAGRSANEMRFFYGAETDAARASSILAQQLGAQTTATQQLGNATQGLARLTDTARMAFAALGISFGLGQLIQMADEYKKFTAQLKMATKSAQEYAFAYENVVRISKAAQMDLVSTGNLYARIANSTRQLGMEAKKAAEITEVINLSLKAGGATAMEVGSAHLQMSQAFAAGALRGDEFNVTMETAPRLLRALADGMGVPIGALRKMAAEGKLTAQMMAEVLPKSLTKMREEAAKVQTIAGAFTALRNNMVEFVGMTAESSGSVSVLAGTITLLADNLQLAAGAMLTLTAVKTANWLQRLATDTMTTVAAKRAATAATLAQAQAETAATATTAANTAARVVALRAQAAATAGTTAHSLVLANLAVAEARATAAASAHTTARLGEAAAMRAASVAGTALRGVMAFLGGPLGAIITLLGVGATAWSVWGNSAKDANDKAKDSTVESHGEIMSRLREQNQELRDRLELMNVAPKITKPGSGVSDADAKRLAEARNSYLEVENRLASQRAAGKGIAAADEVELISKKGLYEELRRELEGIAATTDKIQQKGREKKKDEWMAEYATDAEKLKAKLEEVKKSFADGVIPADLEKRIRDSFKKTKDGTDDAAKAAETWRKKLTEIAGLSGGFYEDWNALTRAYRENEIGLDELTKKQAELLAQQPAMRERAEREAKATKETAEARESNAKFWEAENKARRVGIDAAIEEAKETEELAATFGMTRTELANLAVARLEAQLEQRGSIGLTLDEIEALEELIAAKKRTASAMSNMERQGASLKMFEDIERAAHEAFLAVGDDGVSAFKRIGNTIKTAVLDLLYQLTIKKWIIQIGTSMGLGGASGMAQAGSGGGAGSLLNLASTGHSIYSAISGGFASLSTAVADGVQAIMYKTGMTSQIASNGAFANAAGTAAGYLGGAAVGVYGGRAVSNGYSAIGSGSGNTAVNAGTIIGAVVGGPIGAAIGGLIGGLVNRLFGRRPKEYTSSTLTGHFGMAGEFTGQINNAWKEKGGLFRSDKTGVELQALDAPMVAAFKEGYAALKATTADYAKALGLNSDAVPTRVQGMSVTLGKDEEQNKQAIADFFNGVADTMAREVMPTVDQFKQAGETVAQTLQRLATGYLAVDEVLRAIGMTFGATGVASLTARENLIALAGGIEQLATGTAFFAQNFLTDAERLKPLAADVNKRLTELGLSHVKTLNDFKRAVIGYEGANGQMVGALDLTTEAGRKQYVAMMELAPAFKQMIDLAGELKDAVGGGTGPDLDTLRNDLKTAYDRESGALVQTIDRLKQFQQALGSFKDSLVLGDMSPLTPQQKYAEARSQFERTLNLARAGDENAQANFQGVAQGFLSASRTANASSSRYTDDFMRVLAATDSLGLSAGAQAGIAEQSLAQLKAQVGSLITINESVQSVESAIRNLTMALRVTETGERYPLVPTDSTEYVPLSLSADNSLSATVREMNGPVLPNPEFMAALAAEMAAVREQLEKLRLENEAQAALIAQAALAAAANNAQTVSDANAEAVESLAWRLAQKRKLGDYQ